LSRSGLRTRLEAEDGFSLIELLAALTILLVGILGVTATLDKTRDAVSTSEVRETAVHRAEREIERLRALPYTELALASIPANSPNQADPAFYVQGSQYQWDPADAARVAPLITGGAIAPRTTWTDGRMSGTLQVYITSYTDTAVAGGPQAKRIIVGVTVNGRWSLSRPTTVSTVVHQPPVTP
jgi:prepilin-type N-terminal cleavage/methylation domain-containing protein